MPKNGYYAVAVGRSTGIFTTWDECNEQVKRFSGCKHKKFKTQIEAQAYLDAFTRLQLETNTRCPPKASAEVEENATSSLALSHTKIESRVPIDRGTESWYAVARGRKTGVYRTWNDAKRQVDAIPGARFRKFATKSEAKEFVSQHVAAETRDPDPKDPNTLVAFCDGRSALKTYYLI
ncbi:uncharacterized protein CCR75_002740 [Bremia lactucae]|uniref:ribonuclease H n=1 Tax=Bremia lactucae TaxID=4779 RepID=A0A976IC38_BRELC|nr:hypothetical protein CCR75_002740 [Bremia lactucae]